MARNERGESNDIMTQAKELNSEVWLTLAASTIHGIGVFALRDIPCGTVMQQSVSRRWYSREVLPHIAPEIQISARQRNSMGSGFVHPNADATYQAWMNHSDTPNSTGRHALIDIKKGEEVTEDYRRFNGEIV